MKEEFVGIRLFGGVPENLLVYAPDGSQACHIKLRIREHPQVIGGWLLDATIDEPGPGTRVTVREKAGTIECLDDDEKTGTWGETPQLWTVLDEES